ncbi:thiamine phosphate synthase [Nitritalea halalkaliphila]|nr:thiamine phosphate synthase [Nitritalea halalkaliphila]
MFKGIYVITDEFLTPKSSIYTQVEEALEAGATIVQLRDKESSDADLLPLAEQLQELCRRHKATFIINDRVELAQKMGADGVHIGFHDLSIREARTLLGPDKIIGISCYGDLDRAEKGIEAGADYVAFGAFFPSPTKPKAAVVDKALIAEAKKRFQVPVCVIGGITTENISELAPYGADLYATVSAVFGAHSITDAIYELKSKTHL